MRRSLRRARKVEVALPVERKERDLDPTHFTGLIYGVPKIGKTTFLSQFPDCLFLTTEPGTKGLQIYEIPVGSWTTLLGAVDALEADRSRFKTVVIDTVDLAYDFCLDYTCEKLSIPYPGEDEYGKEDWGKSWREIKKEFTDAVARILRTGRGLWFTSHSRERQIKTRSGDRYDKIGPSMSRQASSVIEALVDIYLYADFFRTRDGKTIRVLVCEGDESIWAGHRETAGAFPPLIPLLQKGAYKDFLRAFNGDHPGIDPATIMATRATSPTASKLVRSMAKEPRKEALPKKKVAKKKRPARRR